MFAAMRFLLPILLLSAIVLGCRHRDSTYYKGEPLRHWETLAVSEKPEQRDQAAEALGKIGPPGLAALMPLLQDQNRRVNATANIALRRMGQEAIPKLNELIHDPDAKVRAGARKALVQQLIDMRQRGVPQLIELLKDRDPAVRIEAAKSFPKTGIAGKAAIPALQKLAEDDDEIAVRQAATVSLRILGSKLAQPLQLPAQ